MRLHDGILQCSRDSMKRRLLNVEAGAAHIDGETVFLVCARSLEAFKLAVYQILLHVMPLPSLYAF